MAKRIRKELQSFRTNPSNEFFEDLENRFKTYFHSKYPEMNLKFGLIVGGVVGNAAYNSFQSDCEVIIGLLSDITDIDSKQATIINKNLDIGTQDIIFSCLYKVDLVDESLVF